MNKGLNTLLIALVLLSPLSSYSADSLSYTGRLVNSDGSPVTGSVNLKVELAYVKADDPSIIIPKCEKTIPANLTNGVFHLKINYSNVECGGTLTEVLSNVPQSPDPYFAGIRITNTSVLPNKIYSFQEINAVPYSAVAKTVSSHGATDGQVLKWDDANQKWAPATDGGGSLVDLQSGTGISVASVDADTWSVAIANLGVGNAQLAADAVTDSKVSSSAAIARTKLASGTANHVLINDGSGVMSSVAALPITQGGTGATTASGAISNLGLGTAAVANIGTAAGEVLGVDNLLTCTTSEKLVWNNPPSIGWTCIGDSNTDSTKLPLAGGLMEGVINMGTFGITNLPEPTNSADAATKNYVDAQITGNTYWTFNLGNVYRTTGKVGVGTSGPASTLHVSSSIADSTSGLRVETTKVGSERAYEFAVQTGGKLGIYDTASATPRITVDTAGNVGIGSTSPQSILDISSTTSGVLIPRLTTVQRDAIVTPATGLQIYNTSTNELQYYNGTAWSALGVAGSGVTSITAGTGLLGGTITSSGTIAVDVGTTASKIVQLDGSAKLPAVDGSALTSLSPANLSGPVPLTKGGTGLTAAGAINTMLGMNAAGTALEYKALTASGLTITHGAGTLDFTVTGAAPTGTASGDLSGTYPSPVVDKIQGIPVDTTDPTSAQILVYSGAAYVPTSISGDATLSAAGALTLGTVPVSKGGTGVTSLTAKGIVSVNALGTGLVSTACASGEVLSFDGSGNTVCTATSSFTSGSFIQNGNTFGAGAVLGTNDAFPLSFETSGTTKMTILADGKVGLGTTAPTSKLEIQGSETVDESRLAFSASDGSDRFTIETDLDASTSNDILGFRSVSSDNIFVLKGNGNVGIGTNAPGMALDVVGSGRVYSSTADSTFNIGRLGDAIYYNGLNIYSGYNTTDASLKLNQDFQGSYITSHLSSLRLNVGSTPTEVMRLTSTGNVGIGTSSPANKLSIHGSEKQIRIQDSEDATGVWSIGTKADVNNTSLNFMDDDVNVRMTIMETGNVGIGTSSPGAVLDIASTTSGLLIPRMTTAQRDVIVSPAGMQIYNTTTNKINFHNGTAWQELGIAADGVTSITAGTGLTGGTITSTGTLAVDVGTTAGKIVQLDGTAKLPAVDGSLLTNLSPANFGSVVPISKGGTGLSAGGAANTILGMDAAGTAMEYKAMSATSPLSLTHGAGTVALDLGTVPVTKGGTGLSSLTANRVYTSNALGTAFQTFSCSLSEVLSFNGLGEPICSSLSSIAGFVNNGNSFGANAVLGTNDAYSLSFETNGATAMTILTSGNVGVGTATPSSKLHVSGDVAVTGDLKMAGGDSYIWTNGTGTGFTGIFDPANNRVLFYTSEASGNVGIGTTTPSEKLSVSGNVLAAAYLYTSDERFKKNITPIPNALDKVSSFRGVTFDWRVDEYPERNFPKEKTFGFIAQEVEKEAPELVKTSQDGFKSVQYGNISALLVEAVKELAGKMENYFSRTDKVERKIASLEKENEELKIEVKELKEKNQKEIEELKRAIKEMRNNKPKGK